jgi:FkbM family methyltransferase
MVAMKRFALRHGDEVLRFSRIERAIFAPQYRGKLRVAAIYSRVAGLQRRPFRGIADVPFGHLLVDTRLRDDWAMLFGGIEQADLQWVGTQVLPGAHAWDVGAHHGYYAIGLGRLVGRSGQVHAFEAFPESAEIARRNVELNGLADHVCVHSIAVGAVEGSAALQLSENGPQNHSLTSALASHGRTLDVAVTTLDVQLDGLGPPDFVKIDVEGGEAAVLQGAQRLLSLCRTTFLFESERWDPRRSETHEVFREHGYAVTSLIRAHERPGTDHRMLVARPPASC